MNGRAVPFAAGLALLAGGTLQAAAHRDSFSDTVGTSAYQLGAWATVVGCVVIAGWVLRQAAPVAGVPAVAAAAGSCLMAALAFSEATVSPALAGPAPQLLNDSPTGTMLAGMAVSTLAFAGGWLSVGTALLRRGARRGPGWAVAVAAVVSVVPFLPGPALLGLALVWLVTSTPEETATLPGS